MAPRPRSRPRRRRRRPRAPGGTYAASAASMPGDVRVGPVRRRAAAARRWRRRPRCRSSSAVSRTSAGSETNDSEAPCSRSVPTRRAAADSCDRVRQRVVRAPTPTAASARRGRRACPAAGARSRRRRSGAGRAGPCPPAAAAGPATPRTARGRRGRRRPAAGSGPGRSPTRWPTPAGRPGAASPGPRRRRAPPGRWPGPGGPGPCRPPARAARGPAGSSGQRLAEPAGEHQRRSPPSGRVLRGRAGPLLRDVEQVDRELVEVEVGRAVRPLLGGGRDPRPGVEDGTAREQPAVAGRWPEELCRGPARSSWAAFSRLGGDARPLLPRPLGSLTGSRPSRTRRGSAVALAVARARPAARRRPRPSPPRRSACSSRRR